MDGNRLKSITGFASPHAILFVPETNNLIVTDGDDNSGMVALVSGKDYSIINKIQLPPGVDGAVFNPINKNYYVEGGGKDPKGIRTSFTLLIPRPSSWLGIFRCPEIIPKPWPSLATAKDSM